MSWFKNITLMTLPAAFNVDVSALESALAEHSLRSPCPLEMETRGFVSPFARDGAAMTHGTDGATLLCLGEDSRVLPASVFNEAIAERIKDHEAKTGRKPGKRLRIEFRDAVLGELLPRAFIKHSRKERQLICNAREVRAIQSGAMTQFRRILKPQPAPYVEFVREHAPEVYGPGALCAFREDGKTHQRMAPCPYGQPGDRLYVKETWAPRDQQAMTERDRSSVFYRADDERRHETDGRWKSPIHMPRWASRLTLEITGVRVERLQDISEADAAAEGCDGNCPIGHLPAYLKGPLSYHYAQLWESINGPGTWDANPWVWVVEFRRIGQSLIAEGAK